jgi:hypothetical protein
LNRWLNWTYSLSIQFVYSDYLDSSIIKSFYTPVFRWVVGNFVWEKYKSVDDENKRIYKIETYLKFDKNIVNISFSDNVGDYSLFTKLKKISLNIK